MIKRQIKFRGKNESGWHYGLLTFMFKSYAISHVEDENTVDLIDKETIGQYTGLKDKNGIEIYEGDILTSNVQPCKMVNQIKGGYGVVRFENGIFKLGAISLITFLNKMEVIGNIYDNPELLKSTTTIS